MHEYAWLKRKKGQYRVIHLSVKKKKRVNEVSREKKFYFWVSERYKFHLNTLQMGKREPRNRNIGFSSDPTELYSSKT